jgi:hypothetical protein
MPAAQRTHGLTATHGHANAVVFHRAAILLAGIKAFREPVCVSIARRRSQSTFSPLLKPQRSSNPEQEEVRGGPPRTTYPLGRRQVEFILVTLRLRLVQRASEFEQEEVRGGPPRTTYPLGRRQVEFVLVTLRLRLVQRASEFGGKRRAAEDYVPAWQTAG